MLEELEQEREILRGLTPSLRGHVACHGGTAQRVIKGALERLQKGAHLVAGKRWLLFGLVVQLRQRRFKGMSEIRHAGTGPL